MSLSIRDLDEQDWIEIKEIYLEGIKTGFATFQTEAPTKEDWFESYVPHCRLGYFEQGKMLGWAALGKVSSRCVYAGVAEVSIYMKADARGKGLGSQLLSSLIQRSEQHGFWTLQTGIFPDNIASIKLHKKAGFREVGFREKLGKLNHTWKDVMLLERRSRK